MSINIYHPRDLALLNLVGISLYRLIEKARAYGRTGDKPGSGRRGPSREWTEDTAIGYEAGWPGINDELQPS